MTSIINNYQGPPNNCTLQNSENPAFALDNCTQALADCEDIITQARLSSDPNQACRSSKQYSSCMTDTTGSCTVDIKEVITKKITDATQFFVNRNYFCDERLSTNLTDCDTSFGACNSLLQDIGRSIFNSQDVCRIVKDFDICRTSMTDTCTPQIAQFYTDTATRTSGSFTTVPYFCGSENACENLFNDCNNTMSVNIQDACGFIPIYRMCLSSISPICNTDQLSNLTAKITQIEKDTKRTDPGQCTTTLTQTTITTTLPTTKYQFFTRNPKFQPRPIGRRPGFLPSAGVTPGHMVEQSPHQPNRRPKVPRPVHFTNGQGRTPGFVQFKVTQLTEKKSSNAPNINLGDGSTVVVPIRWPNITNEPIITRIPKRFNKIPGYVQNKTLHHNLTKPDWSSYGNNSAQTLQYLSILIISSIVNLLI